MLSQINKKISKILAKNAPFIKQVSLIHTIRATELRLKEYGQVENALEINTLDLDESTLDLKKDDLLVRLVCSPINPADVNIIQGKYGILPPKLPALIGNEGLFEVIKSHESNQNFKKGDWVLPLSGNWGTWRSHAVENQDMFYKVPNNLNKHALATLKVNPCTAYLMLTTFKDLKPNDTVIQNGANSAVGQAVIQLGKQMNLNIVNIVRKRDNQEELNEYLRSLGAKYVFTEDELRKSVPTSELWKEIPRPRFALNCVGGKATTDLVRLLDKESTMVTYGAMSKQPLTLNTSDFIFKNFKCFGFWLTAWKEKNPSEYKKIIDNLCDLIANDQFKAPKCEEFRLEEYKEALKRAQAPFTNSKVLFVN